MAPDQQFCLRWNNFQTNITSQFETLRQDEDFVDVTLTCDGKQIKAHKVVLSACSPYFKDLFKNNPCKHPIIFLRDVEWCHLCALVEFMYAGVVNVCQAELSAFLRTAESLHVLGLTDAPRLHKDGKFVKDPARKAAAAAMAAAASTTPTHTPDTGDDDDAEHSCSPSTSPPPSKRERKSDKLDGIIEKTNDRCSDSVTEQSDIQTGEQMDESCDAVPTVLLQQSRSGLEITPSHHQSDIDQAYNDDLADMLEPKAELPDYSSDGESRADASAYMDQAAFNNMQEMMAGPSSQGAQDGCSTDGDQGLSHELFSSRSDIDSQWYAPLRRRRQMPDELARSGPMVPLGPGVEVPAGQLEALKWSDYRKLTRGLAGLVFTPLELATRSVTGQRWSRANSYGPESANRKVKPALDNAKVNAILYHVKSVFPEVEISRIKQVLAYKCQESSVALKMKAGIFQGLQTMQGSQNAQPAEEGQSAVLFSDQSASTTYNNDNGDQFGAADETLKEDVIIKGTPEESLG